MDLIPNDIRPQLKANFDDETEDHFPLVKLFCPWGAGTWLITAMSDDEELLFGLCDLGMGFPEMGYVSLSELQSVKGPFHLTIERDLHFTAKASLMVYAEAARRSEAITEDGAKLKAAFKALEARAKEERRALKARLA